MQQTDDVLWYELKPQRCAEGFEAKDVQIFVEIAHPRRQRNRFNAGLYRALRENRLYGISGSIVIAGDIEPTQARWQHHRCEMISRKRGRHG